MKKRLTAMAALVLAAAVCLASVPVARAATDSAGRTMVRVGLNSTSRATSGSALVDARFQNGEGTGAGYRFGWYDSGLNFIELARTGANITEVTVQKAVGTWHIVLSGSWSSFAEASAEAARHDGGFPAWIGDAYQVRIGSWGSQGQAEAAMQQMGVSGRTETVSSAALTLLHTVSGGILFQFDDSSRLFGIMPDVTGAPDPASWHEGYLYRGGFSCQRIGGGNITVANVLDVDTYVKGVVCYEMSSGWPLEALKAQAVCARTFALSNIGSYSSYGFDVSNSSYSQVYRGMGNGKAGYGPSANSDRACDETAGIVVRYNGKLATTPYSSSFGGASENAANVWGTDTTTAYPYLRGVVDPYEKDADGINGMSPWTVTFTTQSLSSQLQRSGYCAGTSVARLDLTYSPTGNVISMTAVYANGRSNTFNASQIRSVLGLRSIHFTVNGQAPAVTAQPQLPPASSSPGAGSSPGLPQSGFPVNGNQSLSSLSGTYTISGSGTTAAAGEEPWIITGSGTKAKAEEDTLRSAPAYAAAISGNTVSVSAGTYVFNGGGWGHQIGMSQFGAYAMANRGFTYDQIVRFYFPGTQLTLG